MSLAHGNSIVKTGLVFNLDSANIKSYNPNLVTTLGAYNYNFAGGGTIADIQYDYSPFNKYVPCKHDLTGRITPFLSVRVDTPLEPGQYTISCWFKGSTNFSVNFAFVGETINEVTSNTVNITTNWQRFTHTFNLTNAQTAARIQLFFAQQGEGKIVSVYGAQIVRGSVALNYSENIGNNGNVFQDTSKNKYIGSLVNIPSYTTNYQGNLIFDTTKGQYIDFGNPTNLNFGTDSFSLEIWGMRYTNATTNLRILSKGAGSDTAAEAGFALFGSDTGLSFLVNPTGARVGPSPISISVNVPFCVSITVDRSSTVKMYKNSSLISSAPAPAGSVTGTSSLCVGCNSTSSNGRSVFWSGEIYSVKMYNRALSAAEVQQNFEALRGRYRL